MLLFIAYLINNDIAPKPKSIIKENNKMTKLRNQFLQESSNIDTGDDIPESILKRAKKIEKIIAKQIGVKGDPKISYIKSTKIYTLKIKMSHDFVLTNGGLSKIMQTGISSISVNDTYIAVFF